MSYKDTKVWQTIPEAQARELGNAAWHAHDAAFKGLVDKMNRKGQERDELKAQIVEETSLTMADLNAFTSKAMRMQYPLRLMS